MACDLNGKCNDISEIIYLDNNATTYEDKLVIESMINHLNSSNSFGNPSSSHFYGIKAKNLIDQSREEIKNLINARDKNEIIFTSGGTESNNLAIYGFIKLINKDIKNDLIHIITSSFEHPSVLNILKYLQNLNNNIQISFVKINSNGIIDLQHFQQLLKPETKFVTIMHSNNEIGFI